MAEAALLDLDGTLIDANYQHALAWYRAFRRFDIVLPVWRLHRHIGMGGDQYVAAVAGNDVERRSGDDLRDAHSEEFQKLRDGCAPLDGASDHGVSEALYLHDPDRNGIELYRDRPREDWPRDENGNVTMFTRPADLQGILDAADVPEVSINGDHDGE